MTTNGTAVSWGTDSPVRARASITAGTSATPTIGAGSVNITSIAMAAGVYTITFTTALASANYQIIVTKNGSGANPDTIVDSMTKLVGSCTITWVRTGTGGAQSVAGFDFAIYGGW